MTAYSEFVAGLAANSVDRVFMNSDEEKALSVFVEMFKASQKNIRLFSGSLCNNEVSNDARFIEALSDFIDRGGCVQVILNDYKEQSARDAPLFRRLSYYHSNREDQVKVRQTSVIPVLNRRGEKSEIHFCVGDQKAYRIELDTKKRTAECNFNAPEIAKVFIDYFEKIFKDNSTEVNLNVFV